MKALTPDRTVATHAAVAAGAWLLLGATAGLAAVAVLLWARLGAATRPRVIAVAALGVVATAVAWLAGGVPTTGEVAVFTNFGGRDWIDAPARAALGVLAMVTVLPDGPAPDRTARPAVGPSGAATSQRLWEVDRLRAAAIIAVVVIHGLPYRAPVTGYVDYWLSDLLRFSVATFFFVSGWLLPRSPSGLAWLRRRFSRIIPPYLVAAVIMIALARVSPLIEARPVWRSILLGDAVGPYYFVVVLIVLVAITPLLQRLDPRLRWGLLALSVVGALAIEVANLSLYWHNHLPLTWLPYYLAGYQLRPRRDRLLELTEGVRALVVVVAAVLVLGLALAPVESTPRRLLTGLCIWAVLATLLVAATAGPGRPSALTRRLSSQSYLVYLYHPPIVAGVAGAFGSSILTLRPVTGALVALATCLAIGALARLAWPQGAARWLGA